MQRLRGTKGEQGFTLIEFLIIVLIIGILAAIVLPLINHDGNQDDKAQQQVQDGVSQMNACFKERGDFRMCSLPDTTTQTGIAFGHATKRGYKLSVNSASGNVFWVVRHSDGSFVRRCNNVGHGNCISIGGW